VDHIYRKKKHPKKTWNSTQRAVGQQKKKIGSAIRWATATSSPTVQNRNFFFLNAAKKNSVSAPKRHCFRALQDKKNPTGQPMQASRPVIRGPQSVHWTPFSRSKFLSPPFFVRGPCIVCALMSNEQCLFWKSSWLYFILFLTI